MTPQERLAKLTAQLVHGTVAVNHALQQRQASMDLGAVLSVKRLMSLDGIAASLDTLATMEAFAAECHGIWQRWMLDATRQMTAVLGHFPEDERAGASRAMLTSIEAQMALQRRVQKMTADFIDASRIILGVVRRGRELEPDAEGLVLADETDRATFNRQMDRVQAAADEEQRIVEERAGRLRDAMQRLQPG